MTTQRYLLDSAWAQERERLALLERQQDPGTIRHLEALGVGPGWRCLEVGAGGGSIAAWLCERVGASGQVVATDIDTRFLAALAYPHLETRRHDLLTDPLEEGAFDLIHSRAVLWHLAGQQTALEAALRRLGAALKPGGWMLLENLDSVSSVIDAGSGARFGELFSRRTAAQQAAMQAGGADPFYGRRMYRQLAALGLTELGSEGRSTMVRGGEPGARYVRLTTEQLRSHIIATGEMTGAEVDEFCALLDNPDSVWVSPTLMAVWGRRPVA